MLQVPWIFYIALKTNLWFIIRRWDFQFSRWVFIVSLVCAIKKLVFQPTTRSKSPIHIYYTRYRWVGVGLVARGSLTTTRHHILNTKGWKLCLERLQLIPELTQNSRRSIYIDICRLLGADSHRSRNHTIWNDSACRQVANLKMTASTCFPSPPNFPTSAQFSPLFSSISWASQIPFAYLHIFLGTILYIIAHIRPAKLNEVPDRLCIHNTHTSFSLQFPRRDSL